MSDEQYTQSTNDLTERAGAIIDTCSRCGQAVPVTSTVQYERLREAREQAFAAARRVQEGNE